MRVADVWLPTPNTLVKVLLAAEERKGATRKETDVPKIATSPRLKIISAIRGCDVLKLTMGFLPILRRDRDGGLSTKNGKK
jgi:hypothetical protein